MLTEMPLPIERLHPRGSRRRVDLPVMRIPLRRPAPPYHPSVGTDYFRTVEPPVVLGPRVPIAQYPVRLAHFPEFRGPLIAIIAPVAIGMQIHGHLAVRSLDIGVGGRAGQAEEAVQVLGEVPEKRRRRRGHGTIVTIVTAAALYHTCSLHSSLPPLGHGRSPMRGQR